MPVHNSALTEVYDPSLPIRPKLVSIVKDTDGTRTNESWSERIQFWFSEDEHDDAMPPKTTKPNWQLILTVASMVITLATLLCSGIWVASTKSANLDTMTNNITRSTENIDSMKLDIQKLKDEQEQLVKEMQSLHEELADRKHK